MSDKGEVLGLLKVIIPLLLVLACSMYIYIDVQDKSGGLSSLGPNGVEFYPMQEKKSKEDKNESEINENINDNETDNKEVPSQLENTSRETRKVDNEQLDLTEFIIKDRIISKDGSGIEGVDIWCNNCEERYSTISDRDGFYRLSGFLSRPETANSLLEICYRFKEQKDCILQHYKYINSIQSPQF